MRAFLPVSFLVLAGCHAAASPGDGLPPPREMRFAPDTEIRGSGNGPGLGPQLVGAHGAVLVGTSLTLSAASPDEPSFAILRWNALTPGQVLVTGWMGGSVPAGISLAAGDLESDRWRWAPPGELPRVPELPTGVLLVGVRSTEASAPVTLAVPALAWEPLTVPAWSRDRVVGLPEVLEPSGLDWDYARDALWVVGDAGTLVLVDPVEGAVLDSYDLADDYESVRWVPEHDWVLALNERLSQIVILHPATRHLDAPIQIDPAAVQPAPMNGGDGFEGLAVTGYDAAGAVQFVFANQNDPAAYFRGGLTPAAPSSELSSGRAAPPINLSEVVMDWGARRLFALHGYVLPNRIAALDAATLVETTSESLSLSELAAEGCTFGADGSLWIADDTGGIVRYLGQ